jgi:mono/diheme cytochrome c family protein
MTAAIIVTSLAGCAEPDPGQRVWTRKCKACHGPDGRADTKYGRDRPFADLTDGRWKHGAEAAAIRKLIADGDPKSPMPAFRGRITEDDLDAVTAHVVRRFAGTPGTPSSPVPPLGAPKP